MYFSLFYNSCLEEEYYANTIYRVKFGESTPEYITDTEYNSRKLVSENDKMYFTDFDGNLTVK